MNRFSLVMCVSLAFGGCGSDGGSSGLPDDKSTGSLTSAEVMSFCNELAADFPQRTIDCGGGTTITVGFAASECATATIPATCTATVGNFRDCFAAIEALSNDQICMSEGPPAACAAVFAETCLGGG